MKDPNEPDTPDPNDPFAPEDLDDDGIPDDEEEEDGSYSS